MLLASGSGNGEFAHPFQVHKLFINTHVQYRKSVVESLAKCYIQEYPSRAVRGRPFRQSLTEGTFVGDTERMNRRQHFWGKREQRQCMVCSTHQKRHRSSFFCKTCPSNPTLCPDACNEKYYTEVNFKLLFQIMTTKTMNHFLCKIYIVIKYYRHNSELQLLANILSTKT